MPPLLEVRGLEVSYGGARAVDDVDLVVPADALVGLLGPNGAGKTTLLRTIAGLVQPDAGAIYLDGRQIVGMSPHEVAALGVCLIPEGRGIFPALSVEDNLRVMLHDDGDAIEAATQRFPILRERSDQRAGTLSGGEQQMLALARAVVTEPAVMLVDEPSLGLAPRAVKTVMDTLERFHAERAGTILLVEQYATHVLRMAQVVYVLSHGRVAWAGEPAELTDSDVLRESYLGG